MDKPESGEQISSAKTPDILKEQLEREKKISNNVMSIRLSPDGLIIRDKDEPGDSCKKLPGVYCEGIQYYDLNGVKYINNHGLAILIDLMKNLLEIGVEVQFVNVDEKIKVRIKRLGLDGIINVSNSEEKCE